MTEPEFGNSGAFRDNLGLMHYLMNTFSRTYRDKNTVSAESGLSVARTRDLERRKFYEMSVLHTVLFAAKAAIDHEIPTVKYYNWLNRRAIQNETNLGKIALPTNYQYYNWDTGYFPEMEKSLGIKIEPESNNTLDDAYKNADGREAAVLFDLKGLPVYQAMFIKYPFTYYRIYAEDMISPAQVTSGMQSVAFALPGGVNTIYVSAR